MMWRELTGAKNRDRVEAEMCADDIWSEKTRERRAVDDAHYSALIESSKREQWANHPYNK